MSTTEDTTPTKSGYYWVRLLHGAGPWLACDVVASSDGYSVTTMIAGYHSITVQKIAEWGPRIPTPDEPPAVQLGEDGMFYKLPLDAPARCPLIELPLQDGSTALVKPGLVASIFDDDVWEECQRVTMSGGDSGSVPLTRDEVKALLWPVQP